MSQIPPRLHVAAILLNAMIPDMPEIKDDDDFRFTAKVMAECAMIMANELIEAWERDPHVGALG